MSPEATAGLAGRPTAAVAALPDALRLGAVALRVADLGRAIAWYERSLGLRVQERDRESAALGDGLEVTVALRQDSAAHPAGRHAGLYHYALLYPSRRELARAVVRIALTRTPIQGASDHGTHEAVYLADADGNGIELACDRPRQQWPAGLGYSNGPAPLDFDSLLAEARDEPPPATVGEGLRIGHVHLHVGDVEHALGFYRDVLGFEVQAHLGSAAFVSAGGYHHHVGLNVWRGQGIGPAPAHAIGLEHWTIRLPRAADVEAVRRRAQEAGLRSAPVPGGFATQDPWRIAAHVVSP